MWEFIVRYWVEFAFGLVASGLAVAYRNLAKRMRRQDVFGKALQALLRDRIIQAYNHYKAKGYIPIYGRENVEAMYTQYHALGGNGTITQLIEELNELPTTCERGEI